MTPLDLGEGTWCAGQFNRQTVSVVGKWPSSEIEEFEQRAPGAFAYMQSLAGDYVLPRIGNQRSRSYRLVNSSPAIDIRFSISCDGCGSLTMLLAGNGENYFFTAAGDVLYDNCGAIAPRDLSFASLLTKGDCFGGAGASYIKQANVTTGTVIAVAQSGITQLRIFFETTVTVTR